MRRRAFSFVFACPPSLPVQLTCTLTQDGSDHSMNAVGLHQALREQLTTETPQPAWSRCWSCTAAAPAAWRGLKTHTPHMLVPVTFLVLNTVNHAVFVCLLFRCLQVEGYIHTLNLPFMTTRFILSTGEVPTKHTFSAINEVTRPDI